MTSSDAVAALEPYAVQLGFWALGVVLLLVVRAIVRGSLTAWYAVYGTAWVDREGDHVVSGFLLCGLALTAAVLAPAVRAGLDGAGFIVVLSCATAPACLFRRTRSLAFGFALGSLLGSVAASAFVFVIVLGRTVPIALVAGVCLATAGTAFVAGAIAGRVLCDAPPTPAQRRARISALRGRLRQAFASFERRLARWSLIPALAALALFVTATILVRSGYALPFDQRVVVPGAVALALPLALTVIITLSRRWVLLWVGPASWLLLLLLVRPAWVAKLTRSITQRALVRIRYRKALCDTCLRWSALRRSRYEAGRRFCEKCSGEISFRGGPGVLVALAGEQTVPAVPPPRAFILTAEDVVRRTDTPDVTHVRLDAHHPLMRDFDHLTMHLLNHPPSHGVENVAVFPVDGRDALPDAVRNLVDNHMSWASADPLGHRQPHPQAARGRGRGALAIALGALIGAALLCVPRLLLAWFAVPYPVTPRAWGHQLTYVTTAYAVVRDPAWEQILHWRYPFAAVVGALLLLMASAVIAGRLFAISLPEAPSSPGGRVKPPAPSDGAASAAAGAQRRLRRTLDVLRDIGGLGRLRGGVLVLVAAPVALATGYLVVRYVLPALWLAAGAAAFAAYTVLDWLFSADLSPARPWTAWAACGAVLGCGAAVLANAAARGNTRMVRAGIAVPVAVIIVAALLPPAHALDPPMPMRTDLSRGISSDLATRRVEAVSAPTVRRLVSGATEMTVTVRVVDARHKEVRVILRVLDENGNVVDRGRDMLPTGEPIEVRMRKHLSPGSYLLTATIVTSSGSVKTTNDVAWFTL